MDNFDQSQLFSTNFDLIQKRRIIAMLNTIKMKEIIEKALDRLRQRPHNNKYLAEQIEAEIKQKQDECRFKWIQEQNSITLAMQSAKQRESIPKSNISSHG